MRSASPLTSAGSPVAECRDVSVIHGRGPSAVTALDGVHLTIAAGERLSLFGPSGSGKTTLLHALGGLVTPSRGEVRFRGAVLAGLDDRVRDTIRATGTALVFQGAHLLPTLTAYENVAFAAWARARAARMAGRPAAEAPVPDPRALLTLVGLGHKLEALPAELSGGEAQRVAIGRALAQGPELLLCDEPTGHLDSDTGSRVLDLIDALHEHFGFAQVTATHDPDVAARAPRTVVMQDGRIAEEVHR